jgi:hypothetical protein
MTNPAGPEQLPASSTEIKMLATSASEVTHPWSPNIHVSREEVETYARLFVNQPYYAQMTKRIGEEATYFQPRNPEKQPIRLTIRTLHEHLTGRSTLMFYAINPSNQKAKWLCLDADYPNSEPDLERIKEQIAVDGVSSVYEDSRRGGHLWVLFSEPLSARDIRRYILNLLAKLSIPLAKGAKQPGIEVYPRQDEVNGTGFGNGVRGPLGIHRKDGKRYWFRGTPQDIHSQLSMLVDLPKLSPEHMKSLLRTLPPEPGVVPTNLRHFDRQSFSIFDYFPPTRTNGRYEVQCPSCTHHHLAITAGSSKNGYYICFNGCSTAEVRAALGRPVLDKYRRAE